MSDNKKTKSKSKVLNVKCPYCDEFQGLAQNLNRHIQNKHPKKFINKRKGEQSIEESLKAKIQKKSIEQEEICSDDDVNETAPSGLNLTPSLEMTEQIASSSSTLNVT